MKKNMQQTSEYYGLTFLQVKTCTIWIRKNVTIYKYYTNNHMVIQLTLESKQNTIQKIGRDLDQNSYP